MPLVDIIVDLKQRILALITRITPTLVVKNIQNNTIYYTKTALTLTFNFSMS